MSQYTTDEVLQMMEDWYEEHTNDEGFDPYFPFKGFDRLLGTDLRGIDLSKEIIDVKAEEWRTRKGSTFGPPWIDDHGKLNLVGSQISDNMRRADLSSANLQGGILHEANLQRASLYGTNLQGSYLGESNLSGADCRRANFQGASLGWANLQEALLLGAFVQGGIFPEPIFEGQILVKRIFKRHP